MFHFLRMTCRHFRYQVPREYADELRDADPETCPVCDVLPHRQTMVASAGATAVVACAYSSPAVKPGWWGRLLGKRVEINSTLPAPVRAPA